MKQIEVVFCGKSVYLSGLAASLRLDSRLRIVELDAALDEAANELKLLRPEVLVAEFIGHGALEALRREYPGLWVIGVEAATDTLIAFTGRTPERAPVGELARLIMAGGPTGEDAAGADGRKGTA